MIIALFAVDDIGGMGFKDSMPWPRNKEDMQWFKSVTQNQLVAMGKKTWDSEDMPSPLPGRINVLFTNNFLEREDIIQLRGSITDALLHIQQEYEDKDIFVIGGPTILLQAKPVIEKIFLTRIPGEYLNDVKIDIEEFLSGFVLTSVSNLESCRIEHYETV
jgi:dihydrofolate reductase